MPVLPLWSNLSGLLSCDNGLYYHVSGWHHYLLSHFLKPLLFFHVFFFPDIPEIPESIKFCKSLEIADFSGNPLSR